MSKEEKIKIFFIEKAYDNTVGGSHTCLYNLVSKLDMEKFIPCVGFYQNNSYVEKLVKLGVAVHLIGWKPVVCGNVLVRKMRNWYRLVYMHRKELGKIITRNEIDLVVLNNTIANCDDIVDVCRRMQVPVIAYERGYLEYSGSDIRLSERVQSAIAVSYAVKKNMESQKYRANSRVIYDGIPLDGQNISLEMKSCDDIKLDIGIPHDSIVIGIIGNIREWKGQEYFVRAFMALGEKYTNMYGIVVGGHGTEDMAYYDSVKAISESSAVGGRIKFLGFREDAANLLRIMDVFVHASIKPEPFGMVVLEAMYQKVPVIATDFGGPVESLDGGRCGILVPPGDASAISEGVEKYLNNPAFRNEMVERAHKRVVEVFNLRRTISQVEDLFQESVAASDK
ncbi:MAG: hypothetical protein H6Q52_2852 [Deltaproteobacteria bacterium]|nr:hypothetical protein [Deltaproteobacteria bacterium]